MRDCAPCCKAIPEKHHSVILELVYSLTDTREKPSPIGQPLTQAQAWARHYPAKGRSAATRCSAMLKDVDCAASLARHRMSKAERVEDDWVDLRGGLVATGRARLFDFVTPQDPDSAAVQSLESLIKDGLETKDPETGEKIFLTSGKRYEKARQRRIDGAAQYRMKRPAELTDDQRAVVSEFQYDPSRGILKYKLETLAAIRTLSEIDGKRSITINDGDANRIIQERLDRVLDRIPDALAAIAEGDEAVAAWLGPALDELEDSGRVSASQLEGLRGLSGVGGVVGVLVGFGV